MIRRAELSRLRRHHRQIRPSAETGVLTIVVTTAGLPVLSAVPVKLGLRPENVLVHASDAADVLCGQGHVSCRLKRSLKTAAGQATQKQGRGPWQEVLPGVSTPARRRVTPLI